LLFIEETYDLREEAMWWLNTAVSCLDLKIRHHRNKYVGKRWILARAPCPDGNPLIWPSMARVSFRSRHPTQDRYTGPASYR
jgi:hypothetical protein